MFNALRKSGAVSKYVNEYSDGGTHGNFSNVGHRFIEAHSRAGMWPVTAGAMGISTGCVVQPASTTGPGNAA